MILQSQLHWSIEQNLIEIKNEYGINSNNSVYAEYNGKNYQYKTQVSTQIFCGVKTKFIL